MEKTAVDGTIIKLSMPVEAFGNQVSEIVLREPKGGLFARLGLPRILVFNRDTGSGYYVDQNEVIKAYLEALVDMDGTLKAAVLPQLALADSLRVREALFDFFEVAGAKVASMR